MKKSDKLFLLIVVVFLSGCSSGNLSKEGLPCIDVRKKYPEKEILLTDIADVEYVHLSTEDDDYLYRGYICDITENTIVVNDYSGSILFFSRDGKPKSRFNRKGGGPGEYPSYVRTLVYDEIADEAYLHSSLNSILVYSSTGKYKRQLPLSASMSSLVDFDDRSLFLYDEQLMMKRLSEGGYTSSQSLDSSFIRISKEDGRVLEFAGIPYRDVDIALRSGSIAGMSSFKRIIKCASGLYLCNPESDTVFLYGKDKSITPIICKTPLASNLDPKVVLQEFTDVGKYQFMVDSKIVSYSELKDYPPTMYGRDKQTGEIFSPKISLPDYQGELFKILGSITYFDGKKMLACINMDLFSLKEAYKENRLSGQLKELVATLNEEVDNEVYAIATFK